MEYANRLEVTQPSHARTLKAELHQRATELSMNAVEDKAEMVHDGVTQTNQGIRQAKELAKQLLSKLNETGKNSNATLNFAGSLQKEISSAKAKNNCRRRAQRQHCQQLTTDGGEE